MKKITKEMCEVLIQDHNQSIPIITLHREKPIDRVSIEDLCTESCEKGDRYYLLIMKEKKSARMIKCFPE